MLQPTAQFPNVIDISAQGEVFILKTDKIAVCYQSFDNLAQDVRARIRPEFKMDSTADCAGSC